MSELTFLSIMDVNTVIMHYNNHGSEKIPESQKYKSLMCRWGSFSESGKERGTVSFAYKGWL